MRALFLIIALVCTLGGSCFAGSPVPAEVAQHFYDKYVKIEDTRTFVLKSHQVTDGFKKAYSKYMRDPDSDPFINGQDVPQHGYAAAPGAIKGDTATVAMKARDRGFDGKIELHFIRKDGVWLINGVNGLRGP